MVLSSSSGPCFLTQDFLILNSDFLTYCSLANNPLFQHLLAFDLLLQHLLAFDFLFSHLQFSIFTVNPKYTGSMRQCNFYLMAQLLEEQPDIQNQFRFEASIILSTFGGFTNSFTIVQSYQLQTLLPRAYAISSTASGYHF